VINRLFLKSINRSRVHVSKTGETLDLKMGMAILCITSKIQFTDKSIFSLLFTQHSCRSLRLKSSKGNLSDNQGILII